MPLLVNQASDPQFLLGMDLQSKTVKGKEKQAQQQLVLTQGRVRALQVVPTVATDRILPCSGPSQSKKSRRGAKTSTVKAFSQLAYHRPLESSKRRQGWGAARGQLRHSRVKVNFFSMIELQLISYSQAIKDQLHSYPAPQVGKEMAQEASPLFENPGDC